MKLGLIHLIQTINLLMIINPKGIIADVAFVMPDEGKPHTATWMAYGATIDAWGESSNLGTSRKVAREDLIRIAANLARFETVKMIINEDDLDEAQTILNEIKDNPGNVYSGDKPLPDIEAGGQIQFLKQPVNDLWTRDTSVVFVRDENKNKYGVKFNFNGWGQDDTGAPGWTKSETKIKNGIADQRVEEDRNIADFIIEKTEVKKLDTWLVLESGGFEVNGRGTAICTKSCIINDNRNPRKTEEEIEKELSRVLGLKKIIWLEGIKAKEITDGHVDFYARFVADTTVVISLDEDINSSDYNVTQANYKILKDATDAEGNKLTVIPLIQPNMQKVKETFNLRNEKYNEKPIFNADNFAAGYVGFYLANNCVLMAKFGDEEADNKAFEILKGLFSDRTIMQITTDGIANGGGTIHCATQQEIQ